MERSFTSAAPPAVVPVRSKSRIDPSNAETYASLANTIRPVSLPPEETMMKPPELTLTLDAVPPPETNMLPALTVVLSAVPPERINILP